MPDREQLYNALAYVITRWRLEANLTRESVYTAAHLHKNVYIRLEEGDGTYSPLQLQAIARVYNRRASDLMRAAESVTGDGEVPHISRNVREWRRQFG